MNVISTGKVACSIQLLRNATIVIRIGNTTLLVDPMLSAKGAMDPVPNAGNDIRIPTTNLPLSDTELDHLLQEVDAVLITHTHRDHWDVAAQKRLDKQKQIFCQPADVQKIKDQGFSQVTAIETSLEWNQFTLYRTGGQHGTSEIGKVMGPVSGFVIQHQHCTLYIAGDTIWCDEVADALQTYKPQTTILNSGGAAFTTGGPIIMTAEDVQKVLEHSPHTRVIAVHMEALNHCWLTRKELASFLTTEGLLQKVSIPVDGKTIQIS
ncbi:L-ascorbate metabolism protein UlaG, beta-lactamase superfamily [Filimonas lacunae]|uniref:L-ascorbate metabolism protein UlaG, beta-lactamase superfamily n=1 Tax=Filimonas lacunae TaxID=477680 RepID=A0A173MCY4_9BACT|nr:MBL fold metallo-hydrolase [Filimonas lacunae]BAV05311.1 beta-lactamase-like protein [Filimonas lacunae]SIT22044.1 L-ascorbate metabolism protein UlaG, beta-lactamase superfamily [Filimonas lacunae]